ncbi:glycosyltransferase family 2 protein [Peribacillus simplex]|uniref:UDP-Glc:alpha-D-GlcNAc-diphosphoundecaprenol beta-1,3-glucosyltransferase WfgD n=1 Tax=Peribacillus simplex TaxID=1478 RepID=A0A9W4KVR2_9BACI|nr:glycosyltransferase family 2 protein [Peribacillus simplex]CAH0175091.1 UDP-Glc:alpha-D-GlcNAc-diphosphoundecaprenol beta-1,3-glucosyltransferase WfgD [Peribacillus simplex]
MDKKVSVIIPTFKRSNFLLRAIDSVLNQTYPNIEIVVVDDNAPDSVFRLETQKKMYKYENNKKVLYIKNTNNLGGALARNQGIKKAKGDYITFLDDDDIYLPEKISTQIEFMINNKLDMSFTNVRIHNSDDKLVDFREHKYVKSNLNDELLKQHLLHHLTPTSTYMYKKESLLDIGGFDDAKIGQEFKLMIKSIESGLKIGYIPHANIIQYLHDGERISVGRNKIEGEKELYNFKKRYFNLLSLSQRNYVRFRHHAVMMVVGKRSKKYSVLIKHLILALFASPKDFLLEPINHIFKLKRYKNHTIEKKTSLQQ